MLLRLKTTVLDYHNASVKKVLDYYMLYLKTKTVLQTIWHLAIDQNLANINWFLCIKILSVWNHKTTWFQKARSVQVNAMQYHDHLMPGILQQAIYKALFTGQCYFHAMCAFMWVLIDEVILVHKTCQCLCFDGLICIFRLLWLHYLYLDDILRAHKSKKQRFLSMSL